MTPQDLTTRGTMIGCSEEWEFWRLDGQEWHLNVRTGEVMWATRLPVRQIILIA